VKSSTSPRIVISASLGTLRAPEGADPLEAPDGQHEAERAADDREQHAFGQELAHDAPPGWRRAPPARRSPCGRASARDSCRLATFAHATSSTSPTAAIRIRSERRTSPTTCSHERHDVEGQPAVGRVEVRVLAPQPRGDRIHLGLRRRFRHARLQLADDVVVLAVAGRRRVGGSGRCSRTSAFSAPPSVGSTSRGSEKDEESTPKIWNGWPLSVIERPTTPGSLP
jgi:hypothetical protein